MTTGTFNRNGSGRFWRLKIWFNPPFLWKCLYQVRAIAVFSVFRLLTDFFCLLTYEFCLSLWKIARCSVILLLPLFTTLFERACMLMTISYINMCKSNKNRERGMEWERGRERRAKTYHMGLVEEELLTRPKHLDTPSVISGVRATRCLVLCVMFCRSLFVLLSFLPLYCLSFFDIRILITPLVSSSSSLIIRIDRISCSIENKYWFPSYSLFH